tara:strand:- start:44596 stop:44892 length:297 start_codon:yes stop_codon:yes gene_type:complete
MTETLSETKEELKLAEVEYYNLIFFNDDVTPYMFVVVVLTEILGKSMEEAEKITLQIHESDAKVVHRGEKTELDRLHKEIQELVEEEGLTFKTTVEKE